MLQVLVFVSGYWFEGMNDYVLAFEKMLAETFYYGAHVSFIRMPEMEVSVIVIELAPSGYV